MNDFDGKVVIVTGARTGIGLSAATLFAKAGAAVVLVGRHEPKKEADNLVNEGYKATSFEADVSKEADTKAMVDFTVKKFGRLDFAYNNAGVQSPVTKTEDLSLAEYDNVLNINLKGIFLSMKYELKQMSQQESKGAIVNCSSMGGLVGIAGRTAYHASKHGVLGLTKSSALEYAKDGIRINAVCPGIIETPMVARIDQTEKSEMDDLIREVPIGRLAHPEEVAQVVLFLCSNAASYIVGQGIPVDGGYTIH